LKKPLKQEKSGPGECWRDNLEQTKGGRFKRGQVFGKVGGLRGRKKGNQSQRKHARRWGGGRKGIKLAKGGKGEVLMAMSNSRVEKEHRGSLKLGGRKKRFEQRGEAKIVNSQDLEKNKDTTGGGSTREAGGRGKKLWGEKKKKMLQTFL